MRAGIYLTALSCAISASLLLAGTPKPPTATSPSTATTQLDLTSILKNLSSEEFTTRQFAQKQLDSINYKSRAMLLQFADQQSDPEVKARLLARIADIDEELAIDPPPISLDIKQADRNQMVAALSKALGAPIRAYNQPDFDPNKRWTLSVTDQPFWEVFRDLNHQHGLVFANLPVNGDLYTMDLDPSWSQVAHKNGIAFFPLAIILTPTANPQRPPDAQIIPRKMIFRYWVAADPRLKIIQYSGPTLSTFADDAGNILYAGEQALKPVTRPNQLSLGSYQIEVPLNIPQQLGKSVPSIKVSLTAEVIVSQQIVTIKNADKGIGQSCVVGERTFTIDSLRSVGDATLMILKVEVPLAGNPPQNVSPPPMLRLIDSSGAFSRGRVPPFGGSVGITIPKDAALPLTLELATAIKTRQITIPFEFKNLLLP